MLATEQLRELFADHIEEFKKTLKGRDLEIFNDRLLAEEPVTLQAIGRSLPDHA